VLVYARGAPGVVQQHQRREPPGPRLVGHQPAEQIPDADRLVAQLRTDGAIALARRIALVEDQMDNAQNATQPIGQILVRRNPVGDLGGPGAPRDR
jgi:hypothetical protein